MISESRFQALKTKLRELFELDKSDLDFGIYRIIAAKNKEVTEFLDRQLKNVVKATLAAHGAGAADQVQAELDKAIEQARTLGADPETLPKVKELRTRLESAGGAAAADLEADIYNHLLAFFSRYYDEGDFISQRRYKGDTYAIPYSGEEVTLHWANKDQYYIKSGEWHKDYRFKVGSGDKTVRFKLVEATQEVANNKEADDAKRRYILAIENPVEDAAGTLTLRFEFRVPTQAEKDRAAAGSVAVFGGDYAKASNPKKGDEREQFCADAEKRALAAMPEAGGWRALIATPGAAATADKPARTLLGKHLDHFSARNTFDYFIHKDLGGFLRRELDFYLKNEVVRLDDLETLPPDHLQRVQGKVKAIRAVAARLIAFLGSLEDFQKKMWLKKKFVLNTNWLVTVDRIPPALRDVVASNVEQWAEWERLGFKPENTGDAGLFGGAAWATREYLEACDKLPIDTRFFAAGFVAELLASVTVLGGDASIDAAASGVAISGDNAGALGLLSARYAKRVKCVYIDPPYNTGGDDFVYKDGYQRSTWGAMIRNRLASVVPFLMSDAGVFVSIDENEQPNLRHHLNAVLGEHNFVADMVWAAGRKNDSKLVSVSHEYIVAYAANREHLKANNIEWRQKKKGLEDIYAAYEKIKRKRGTDYAAMTADLKEWFKSLPKDHPARDHSHYSVVDRRGIYFPADISWPGGGGPKYTVLHPKTRKPVAVPSRGWMTSDEEKMAKWIEDELVHFGEDESAVPCIKSYLKDREYQAPYSVFYQDGRAATKRLREVMGNDDFGYPKDEEVISELVGLLTSAGDVVLDYLAGSGTTAHAALALLREHGVKRQFITVEVGNHFRNVLLPRIAKIAYAPDWSDGHAARHDRGLSAVVKYFALESYEDALNNLPAPTGTLLDGRTDAEKDALITYGLDLELGPHLLNLDAFRDPWGYTINAQLAGDAEIKRHRVDLVETFNYLIGLKVHAYGPLERYSADFERAAHADGLGRIKLTGRLRRDANGPYVFQRVEGELNDGNSTRVLVVWRKRSDDPEKDAAVLDAWMARHRESTRERTEHRDYHLTYINGPVTLPQPTAEIRTVFPIEETFKTKMFEDTDGGGGV